jgi:MFS family permease
MQSMFQGLTYVGGILFSGIVTKKGVGPPVMIASALGGLALFFSAFSVNIYMVIVLVGFVGGMAMSINYLCAFVAVGWMFVSNRRSALAFLTMATAVGQTLLPNLANYLINVYGWTGTFMVAGGLVLNSIPCGLLLHFSQDFFFKETNQNLNRDPVKEKMSQ